MPLRPAKPTHLRPIDKIVQHLTGSASRRSSRLLALGLLAAVLAAPSLLVSAHAALVVEPLLATAIVAVLAALSPAVRQPLIPLDVEFRALHDVLTGLPNRMLFDDRLGQALAQSTRDGDGAAVMVVDLDRFKEINDTHGHAAGDAALREIAERLAATMRNSDTVARLGGDEFGVILSGSDVDGARESASRMQRALARPVTVDGSPVDVGASIGIAVHPLHGDDAKVLLQRADAAMYQAKRAGLGYAIFDPASASTLAERRRLATDLRDAVARRELHLHYQPRIDLRTGDLVAVEALARWQHPTLGLLTAGEFMTLAEEIGLGTAICDHIVSEAAAQCAAWQTEGAALRIAVNVDGRSIVDPGFPQRVAQLLDDQGIDPQDIELELGEDSLLTALSRAQHVVFDLADLGVQIVVDNFGTGYSSLGYLAHVPISKLKLHHSLVQRAAASARERIVVVATIDLAHELGLEVVAEGVEDDDGLEFVRALGIDYAQGYHLGVPAPAAALPGVAEVA